jgi:hypothetical protein
MSNLTPDEMRAESAKWLKSWVKIGLANPWIREACDPFFDADCILVCGSEQELLEQISRCDCWGLGQGFALGNICLINQVNGRNEFLVIKEDHHFNSYTVNEMLRKGTFLDYLHKAQNKEIKRKEG